MGTKNSHCSHCGTRFPDEAPWPRTCVGCERQSYLNPTPVAVALLPVDGGLLTIRRDIEPARGKLALPGGYIDFGETWQAACARELWEETGVRVDASGVREFRVRSADDGTLLIFGLAEPVRREALAPARENHEVSERVVIAEPREMAFSLHEEIVREFFGRTGGAA